MDALINVVLPVFGIILTGYLAGRFEALGPDSAAALNRFVFYFALPCALFIFTARAPSDKIFNWPFIGAMVGGALLTVLVALIVGRLWFHHHDVATLSMIGLTAGWGNYGYMGLPLLLTAYGPDGALPTIVASFSSIILFVGSTIAVLEGTRRFRVIVTSCVRALGPYAIAQPAGDFATARHPFFNGRTPSSQGGQQLSRSYGRSRSAGGPIRLGAFARRSQTDRQYGRGDMACNAESRRQSHFDVCTGHQRICYGAVVVAGGSHTLGNACCRKYLRHRSAIQCVLQDRVVSHRHVNGYVDSHDFLLADLVRGWLSEDSWFAVA